MIMDKKTHYCYDFRPSQFDVQVKCNHNKSLKKLFYEYQTTHFKVYMQMQKAQNSQYNVEEEESRRTDTIQLQDLL